MQEVTAYDSYVKLQKLMTLLHTQIHNTKGVAKHYKRTPKQNTIILDLQGGTDFKDGLILKGTRIVVPSTKQAERLKLIHEGHLGLTKCKLRVK